MSFFFVVVILVVVINISSHARFSQVEVVVAHAVSAPTCISAGHPASIDDRRAARTSHAGPQASSGRESIPHA